jgi:2-polyprenyl-3-methyl-5-hydroxy-6-metoxy-1,4-benzoquinol methylase
MVVSGIRDWEYGAPGEFEHRRCSACGSVQLHPFPSVDALIDAYRDDYHGYLDASQKGLLFRALYTWSVWATRRRLSNILKPGARVLDIGCGSGELLVRLASLGATQLDGIDFSARAVALAANNGLTVFRGLFTEFEAANETYDVIFMNNYLEHTVDPTAEVEKALRLLRPGGFLVGEVPNYRSVGRWIAGRFWGGNHAPRHTFQFEPKTLEGLLQRGGFERVQVHPILNPGHLALSFQNWMQRNRTDLATNTSLHHGRSSYYSWLLLALAPLNLLVLPFGKTGAMQFDAVRPWR